MIKYNLTCKDCSNTFDSWFSTSKEYEKVKKLNLLNCHICDSKNITKSLMTPNVLNAKKKVKFTKDKKMIEVKKKIKEYQKFIKNNFEYVGDRFAHEARSIFYDEKKSKKSIYGNASMNEVNELKEEGIEAEVIPWINDKEN